MNKCLLVFCLCLLNVLVVSAGAADEGHKAVDVDGNQYSLIEIGGHYWFAENLRTSRTAKGRPTHVRPPNDDSRNLDSYGALYTWKDAMLACPNGYHLPTNQEWADLQQALAGDIQLTDSNRWAGQRTSSESSLSFAVVPAGYASDAGLDSLFGERAVFWSATADGEDYAWAFSLKGPAESLEGATQHPHYGFSVRCLSDNRASSVSAESEEP